MALTPSWTRAFQVCSNFLMNLGTNRRTQKESLLPKTGLGGTWPG